jgi:type II secretory pathway component PulF
MLPFDFVAIEPGRGRVTGTLRGGDRRQVIQKLIESGVQPVWVAGRAGRAGLGGLFRRVGVQDLSVFTRQLAALTKAGLPLAHALATLRRQCSNKTLTELLEDLEQGLLRDGMSFAETLAQHPRVFNPVYRGLVHAAEAAGRLPEVLAELAGHLGRAAKLRGQVRAAFVYPVFLMLAGSTAIFVLMTFIIPTFITLFDSFDRQLPLPTRLLIAVSGFMRHWWPVILLAAGCGAAAGWGALRRQGVRSRRDRLLLRLPVVGEVLMKVEVARIAQTLAALVAGGVHIVDALHVTEAVTHNQALRDAFGPIRSKVAGGQPVADAFDGAKLFPLMFINLVRTGEESGDLPEMLAEVASIYTEESERALDAGVKILEPVLIVGMGLIIAVIVAAVMLPIFQSNALVH